MSEHSWQAVLLVAFGGPEGPEDVMPFLENVVRGRNIPRQRLLEVAEHYQHFGGRSPLNDQNRALARALEGELRSAGFELPVYLGNRNWNPYFADTLRQMGRDGVRRALALFTSPYGSYSSCRQYRENLEQARAEVGEEAPELEKVRQFFDHPGFVEAAAARTREALDRLPPDLRERATIFFSAHSIPVEMARTSPYVGQLEDSCRLVADRLGRAVWRLVFQSRSGPPHQPWLEPDILDALREAAAGGGLEAAVVVPLGFLSDHVEVLFDLDTEAREVCSELGVPFERAGTVGDHPLFVRGLRELLEERLRAGAPRLALRPDSPGHRTCGPGCCLAPAPRRPGGA